jgi:hypothetical protein
MAINYDSLQIGEVRADQVTAARGVGASLLRFTIIWSMHPKRDHTYSVFGTYLRVSVGAEGTAESLYLGHAMPEVAWTDETRSGIPFDRALMYYLTLQADQLLALEQLRQGRGLRFILELRGNSHGPSGIRQIDSSLNLIATQSDWVRILREANAKDILLVGVEIPVHSGSSAISAAIELVRRAYQFLLRGEDSAAVAECRRALESAWKSGGLEQSARSARKALSANMDAREAMSKRDRQLALGEAIINLAHPAHHVQGAGNAEDFSRTDAALAVSSTAALISSLACVIPTDKA